MVFSITRWHRQNDKKIAKDIQEKVASDSDTKDSQVNVSATGGKVRLTGKVNPPVAQKKVEQIAKEELGTADI